MTAVLALLACCAAMLDGTTPRAAVQPGSRLAGYDYVMPMASPSVNNYSTTPGNGGFAYGFDYGLVAPERASWNNPAAVSNAQQVISQIPSLQVQATMGWGTSNPEPSSGVYNFGRLDQRIALATATGGTPVIDLCAAPDWMKGGLPGQTDWSQIWVPPTPAHYADFANLAATIAARYPQVKYFIVWKELHGFWDKTLPGAKPNQYGNWDMASYTTLYNMVYNAIKAVRPDAQVGGPYVPMLSWSKPSASLPTTPQGPWGYADQRSLDAIAYWEQHSVGADFLAVDGKGMTNDAGLVSSPLTETQKFAALGQWMSQQTSLPIWWVESKLQPSGVTWTPGDAAAVRVAAFIRMREAGISAGLLWQPVTGADGPNYPDLGPVTGLSHASGGQATPLVPALQAVLPVLQNPVTELPQSAPQTLAATNSLGTIALNAGTSSAVVNVPGGQVTLAAGQVLVL